MEGQQHHDENTNQSINEVGVRDNFCWNCHEKCVKKFSCSKCFRSFHEKCLQNIDLNNCVGNTLICSVCILLERSPADFVDKQWILDLLQHVIAKILREPCFKVLKYLDSITVANAIDLNEIKRKIDGQLYDSLNAFLTDIQCLHHNCCSVKQHKIDAENLVQFCKSEIGNISSCAECYQNIHTKLEWCSLACSRPHLVLWIKLNRSFSYWPFQKGYLCWPAKLVSVDRKKVKAIFFDGSYFIEIPRNNCFTYATKPPVTSKSDAKDMKDVLDVVNSYAQNIRQQFGRFQIKLKSIEFDQRPLITHMQSMFPDYKDSSLDNTHGEYIDESDEPEEEESAKEVPKKIRRISEKSTTSNRTSVSNTSQFDLTFSQNHESSQIDVEKLDESIKCITNFRNSVLNSESTNRSTIQTLNQELDNLKKTHADCEATNSELLYQLKTVTDERDQAKSDAKRVMMKMKEEHAAALNEVHARNETLKKDKKDLRKGLDASHSKLSELQEKLETNHKRELDELRTDHEKQLETEKLKFNLEHEKVTELEQKVQSSIDEKENVGAQLTLKFNQTINNLKVEAKKCKCCGESKVELFCSSMCQSLWTRST